MTRRVHRLNIPIADRMPAALPVASTVVHVAPCRNSPERRIDLWYEIDDRSGNGDVTFYVEGTGHGIDHHGAHVGSVVTPGGMVWHVYLELNNGY